jgi:hypothetical protein
MPVGIDSIRAIGLRCLLYLPASSLGLGGLFFAEKIALKNGKAAFKPLVPAQAINQQTCRKKAHPKQTNGSPNGSVAEHYFR